MVGGRRDENDDDSRRSNKMKFDFLDIGTSDFDTSLDLMKKGQNILLVEPVVYYLNRLPDGKGIFKQNCAISNRAGHGNIYYVSEEVMNRYGMPEWIRGCNSFNKPHETVLKLFRELRVPLEIECERIDVLTFKNLVDLYDISHIGFLKIDTEGWDHIILKGVLSCMKKGLKVKKIKIEYNSFFGNTKEIDNLIIGSSYIEACLLRDNLTIDF